MTPAFHSWQALLAMGGYAFYVWLAVAMTVIPLALLIIYSSWQHRTLLAEVRRQRDRERRRHAARQATAPREDQ